MRVIDTTQFVEACAAWSDRKDTPLAQLLIERGWITDRDNTQVERALEEKLRECGGDVHRALRGAADSAVRASIRKIDDDEINRTLDLSTSGVDQAGAKGPVPGSGELARYDLHRIHSEGGLGRVWMARDGELKREVALKELQPKHAENPDARRRFLKEAQVTGQLEHPNIVPVYELGQLAGDDRPYYTMRFVRGKTLRDTIAEYHQRRRGGRQDPLELRQLLRAFGSLCNAIAYAHSRGVVHRDLKPENVLLGGFGELILLDWGLAKLVSQEGAEETSAVVIDTQDLGATTTGSVMGTPAYMAPEQAEGRSDRVDERTDVYGLGGVLFEILTGRAPHAGDNASTVLRQIVAGETPRPRLVNPSVPPALDAICCKAMAKAPSERYASASDLSDDVERYLADEPVTCCSESWAQRLGRWMRRNRTWTVSAVAALVVGILTATVAAIWLARMADQERGARVAAERMREQSLRVAAKFAARTVASEIDLRWRILEAEAADAELHRLLLSLEKAKAADGDRNSLQTWLETRHVEHSQATRATSWFITNHEGAQVARSPLDEKTIGRSYAFRDYFHGRGRDFAETVQGVTPITNVHRSIVFQSQATHNLMVAFSVPVWNGKPEAPGRRVLGVLAMTVELGRFGALQTGLRQNQMAVMIDTKADWIEGKAHKGLILHSPRLVELHLSQLEQGGRRLPVFRLDKRQVELLEELRRVELERETRRESLAWEKRLTLQDEPLAGSLDRDFRDPVGGVSEGRWLAAFEPVIVKGRPTDIRDSGWVVAVEERYDPAAAY